MPLSVPQSSARDDAVLRHVDEAAGEVTRVRRLERRVGKAFTGAVGRVEVFENRQPLLEVGDDRRLDDLARRLGHQAAHAGKLAHLLLGAAGAGVRHHVDGVDRLFAARLLVVLDGRDAVHHFLGDAVRALRPGIDDLVVFLHLRDEAVIILLLVVENERFGVGDDLLLRLGDEHVVLAEGDAGLIGVVEAQGHDPVAENDRFLLTAGAVDGVDHAPDILLGQKPVHEVEADSRLPRQMLGKDHPARRGVVDLGERVAVLVHAAEASLDLGLQRDCPAASACSISAMLPKMRPSPGSFSIIMDR